MIVRVDEVLNRTVVAPVTNVSTTCAVTFRVKVSCITSVDGIKFWLCMDLIGQLSRDVSQLSPVVIGYRDSKSHGAFSTVRV